MKRIYTTLFVLITICLLAFIWWQRGTSAVNPKSSNSKIFIVEQGQGVKAIAKNLKDEGLIKDQIVFFLLTKKLGIDNRIEAGDYRLLPSMDATQIAKELTHGTLDIWITVPEGQRASEIADSLKAKMPNYNSSWKTVLTQNEGYLFPDTYLFPRDAGIDAIVSIMRNNFDTKYATLNTTKSKYSKTEIVTVASLIEREARHDQDRALVASVIYNRLDLGMSLDLDATVQYAIGTENKWWPTLKDSGKNISPTSPYNSYTNPGLPPTAISNPGVASLQAALNPASSDYLYYITDANGVNHYAKTLAQHEANISKFGL